MKKKLTDIYNCMLNVYISKDQLAYIDKQGKRSDYIRKLIDEKRGK
jgi:hypothetical protein